MTKIPPPDKLPWYMRIFFFFQKRKYGQVLEPVSMWAYTPGAFFGFLWMRRSYGRKSSPLDPVLQALLTVKISQINHCAFCIDMNADLLLKKGGSEQMLKELDQYQSSSLFSEEQKIALAYAEAITRTPDQIDGGIFEKLQQLYSPAAIAEMTGLIGFQNLSSRFNSALDAKAFGFCAVPIEKSS